MFLGIDYGQKRIGLALANGGTAAPYKTIPNHNLDQVTKELSQICQQEKVQTIVIGQPQARDKTSSQLVKDVQKLADHLRHQLDIRVVLTDEAYSSQEAQDVMIVVGSSPKGRKQKADAYAAMVILQSFLDNLEPV